MYCFTAELAAALRQQGDEYSDELKKSFESELLELEDKLRSVLDNHRSEMEKVRNKIEAESSTEKATLEAELKSVHIEVMQALQKEMFALNSRHQAMVADMTADHELAVEEEKLSIYYSLRRQCDQEIERIEADIHDAQCAFAVEIAKSECEAMQQKEEELAAKRASFLATAQLEIDIKNAELDSLGESHEKEMRALEEEHVRMAERVKAEVLISIERKHEAEKTALTTMLSSLQESLRAAIDDRKASLFATSAADIMTAMVKEDEMHVAHVKHINAQIASTYNRFGQEIKFAQSKHNIQLAALQDSYQADLETEYLSDMCRISDEIDLQNIRLEALVVEQPKQPKQHMVMVSFGTQTDGIDGEDCTTDDQLHAVGEDPLSHPPDYGEVLFAQMDELREAIQSEHRKEVELLKVKHSSELSSLETKLNAELNKVNSDFQTFTDNVQSDLQSVKLQLTDARRKEKLARADLQSMSYNGQQTVAALEAQLASLKLALTDQEELHSVEMNRLRSVVERHTTAYGASVEESVSQETEVKYLTDINARLQEHISNLEYVVEKKIVECDQLSLQVQSMFRLIEIYKGQYQETNVEMPSSIYHAEKVNLLRSSDHGLIKEERQVPIINYLMPKSVEHMRNNVVSISGSTVDIDGATYTCSDLVTALKKAVKQKNSAQSLCRQQQLCILALRSHNLLNCFADYLIILFSFFFRLLVRTVENKYEEFKRNRKDI